MTTVFSVSAPVSASSGMVEVLSMDVDEGESVDVSVSVSESLTTDRADWLAHVLRLAADHLDVSRRAV